MSIKVMCDALNKNRTGKFTGIWSICSANKHVLEAAMLLAKEIDFPILIEFTSAQSNQFGGYTGRTPAQSIERLKKMAKKIDLPWERIILGGDHLGPNVWTDDPSEVAMIKSWDLIEAYVKAGARKIHLDCSMFCAGDNRDQDPVLWEETVASRAAMLCRAAEQAWKGLDNPGEPPVYVIGTEVPPPGGAQVSHDGGIQITPPERMDRTIFIHKEKFEAAGLGEDVWNRVIAVVVQPGVEFGDADVDHYSGEKAKPLSEAILKHPGMVCEAHSTDYQRPSGLEGLVKGHFAILKVGPWFTFAAREAYYDLERLERELFLDNVSSNLRRTVEKAMIDPNGLVHWQKHYAGTDAEKRLKRVYSYSDRIRYYWNQPKVEEALEKLFSNLRSLNGGIPMTLLSQFFPNQYYLVQEGKLENDPEALVYNRVQEVMKFYAKACGQL